MGTLARYNLVGLCERYGLKHFVETGTGTGDSLAMAAAAPFVTLHSIEIVPQLAASARARFEKDQRIRIYEGSTADRLPEVLAAIPQGEPVLFWLDAHFAGADYGLAKYDDESDLSMRLPLQTEIDLIHSQRIDVKSDVILIDDARVYQPGPYGGGDLPPDFPGLKGVKRSLDFVRAKLGASHGVVVDYADQGYVLCCPRMTYEQVNGIG